MLLDNLQDAMRHRVPNFSRSVIAALKHLAASVPTRWDVLSAFDVDSIVSTLELSLKLPPPVFLDPRSAPSVGVVQCTYLNCFGHGDSKFRCCYFPTTARRMHKLLAFKLGASSLPITNGRRSGVPRADRHCPFCGVDGLGDELHVVFECAHVQPLKSKYAHLFAPDSTCTDMRSLFGHFGTGFILDSLCLALSYLKFEDAC